MPFTKENARDYLRKSIEVRKARKHIGKLRVNTSDVVLDHHVFVSNSIAHTQSALIRLYLLLQTHRTAKSIDALTKSIERLHSVWSHLTGTPFVGAVRPEKMKKLVHQKALDHPITLPPQTDTQITPQTEKPIAPQTDPPIEQPMSADEPPEPDALTFDTQQKESLLSPADPSPPSTPPPPDLAG